MTMSGKWTVQFRFIHTGKLRCLTPLKTFQESGATRRVRQILQINLNCKVYAKL